MYVERRRLTVPAFGTARNKGKKLLHLGWSENFFLQNRIGGSKEEVKEILSGNINQKPHLSSFLNL